MGIVDLRIAVSISLNMLSTVVDVLAEVFKLMAGPWELGRESMLPFNGSCKEASGARAAGGVASAGNGCF